jgi:hypothetical protein
VGYTALLGSFAVVTRAVPMPCFTGGYTWDLHMGWVGLGCMRVTLWLADGYMLVSSVTLGYLLHVSRLHPGYMAGMGT